MSTAAPDPLRVRFWVPMAILVGGLTSAVLAAVVVVATNEPVAPMVPVQSYTTADLGRLADAVEELADSRLTPPERAAVEEVAVVLDDLATGEAVIEPSTSAPPKASTSTTGLPPTTTVPPPPPTVTPDEWADVFSDDYPQAP